MRVAVDELDELVEVDAAAVVVVVVALDAVVVVVDGAVAVVDAVVEGVAEVEVVELDVVELSAVVALVSAAATTVVLEETCWRAMPRPRALAKPMLSEATRARLRAAGWGRLVLMGRTYGTVVSAWFAGGEVGVRSA